MLVSSKNQIKYDTNLSAVVVRKTDNKVTASMFTGKVVSINDNKTVIQLVGSGHFKEVDYNDYNIIDDDLHHDAYTINRVFTTVHEATVYVNRINNMDLTQIECRMLGMTNMIEIKYVVFIKNEIRLMPIEIRNHKVHSHNHRETKEIDGKTWYCDNTETRHTFTKVDGGGQCDVSDLLVKIFVDPHKAIDFYLGK